MMVGFLTAFIYVEMVSVVGLKSIQFEGKVVRFQKVLKNAQNGSGEAIGRVARG